jgi:hypothetical protein
MTLDEKLDWIASRLISMSAATGGISRGESDEYLKIFGQPKPKPEAQNKRKGLFLK